MSTASRLLFGLGAIAVAAAIGLDAWHSHGLRESLDSENYEAFGRGIRIHYIAGLGLVAAGLLQALRPGRVGLLSGAAIGLGGLLFCAEVYRGALGHDNFGLAPQGGSLSILGWLALGVAALMPARGARA